MINEKVALITGAGRGIGNAIAVQLSKEGYAVAIMDTNEESKVAENLQKVKDNGHSFIYLRGDITSKNNRKEIIDKVMSEFGRIDVLVNNAGVAPKVRMDILDTTEESIDFVLGINLKGTFFFTQAVANTMINEIKEYPEISPKIINISSMSAYTSSYSRGEYCISKAGISMITKLLQTGFLNME